MIFASCLKIYYRTFRPALIKLLMQNTNWDLSCFLLNSILARISRKYYTRYMHVSPIVWYYNRSGGHDTRWLHVRNVDARRWKKVRESSREAISQGEKYVSGLADNGVSELLFASILHSTSFPLLPSLLLFLHSCIAPPWLWQQKNKKKKL